MSLDLLMVTRQEQQLPGVRYRSDRMLAVERKGQGRGVTLNFLSDKKSKCTQISVLPLPGSSTLDKLFNLSEFVFSSKKCK